MGNKNITLALKTRKKACLPWCIKRIFALLGNIVSPARISCQEAPSESSKQTTLGARMAVNNALPLIYSSSEGYFFSNQTKRNRTKPNKTSSDKAAGMFCVWMAQGGTDLICSIGVQCRVDFWLPLLLWPSSEGWHAMKKIKRTRFISGIMLSDAYSYSPAASPRKNNNDMAEALSSSVASITLMMTNLMLKIILTIWK